MSLKDTDVRTPGDEAIAKKFKLSLTKVRQLVKQGAKHEKEHNTDIKKAEQVARDHIAERPDYYKMLKKAEKTDKNHMKEESGVGDVRGLGYVSGDPAVDYVNSYITTNAMSYEDQNGNKLEYNKKNHNKLHKMTFNDFNPKNIKNAKNFVNEGISAGPERSSNYAVGDAGGGRTLYRKLEVKEGARLEKAKKAAMAGITAANLYTAGDVMGKAAEGRGSTKGDVVRMATTLPGAAGWAATGVHYAKKAYDKVKQMKEDKDPCWKGYEMVGMKKKGGRKVPNCVPVKESGQVMSRYTERPTYENKSMGENLPKVGGVARGIYQEGYASIGHAYDWAGDVNRKAKFYGNKPKATTTKSDEKDDTYKDSNKGKKVKFAKTVKEAYSKYSGKSHSLHPLASDKGDLLRKKGSKDETLGQYSREFTPFYAKRKLSKELGDLKRDIKSNLGKHTKPKHLPESQIDEISAELVGKVSNARFWQGKAPSKTLSRAIAKKFIESGKKKEEEPPFTGGHKRSHEKSSTHVQRLARKAMEAQKAKLKEAAVDVAAMQHMDAAKSGEYRPARASQSRVNLRGSTAHVKGASYQSGTGSARASLGTGAGQMKPTTTNVPFRGMRSVKGASSTQGAGGQLKPTSTSGSSSFTPNSQSRSMNVGKAMGASKQTSSVVKGMSAAGQEASKKIVPKAASVVGAVGKVARGLGGPEGAAVTAAAEPLAKKMAASHAAGHQSFTPHGAEGEKTSSVFARMKQPSQGRSISSYEKDVLTPKASEAPKPKVDAPTPPTRPDYFSRGQAFGAARKEAGGGEGKFSYDNKSYQTNVKSEPYKPASQLKQTSIKEELMDTKELIHEAIGNIMEENLHEMKDNFLAVLQEKTMQKLEERKKEIAANYFAQD